MGCVSDDVEQTQATHPPVRASSEESEAPASAPYPTHDRVLAQYLESHDERCPACKYNLRHLRTTRCPECGLSLRIVIGPVHTTRRFYTAGVIGLASAFGFSTLTLVWFVILFLASGGPETDYWIVRALMLMSLVSAGLLFAWLVQARRINQASTAVRATLATTACVLPLVYFIIFLAMLFSF
jgi:hypothetical protein